MSTVDQLQALMTKNVILMKRNPFSTLCEIFFPMILMLLLAVVRGLFSVTDTTLNTGDDVYLQSNSTAYLSLNNLSSIMASGQFASLLSQPNSMGQGPMITNNSQGNKSNSSLSFYGLPVKNGQL